jgi:NAD(P)-dependent dehydrogenase (short-subunit alcohol dehydrogenase family)
MFQENQRVIVIGGSSGIGLGISKAVAKLGASVVIASRSREKLDRAVTEIGSNVTGYVLDVSNETSVKNFFNEMGEFDHLVTPGSTATMGPFFSQETSVAREGFDSKFWGQYYAARYGAPNLRPGGSIVMFSGISSHRPPDGGTLPSAINSAVEGLGRALAVELAPIRVNIISPGLIDTPAWEKMDSERRGAMFNMVSSMVSVGRVGKAEDIAKAAIYLMSNSYSTGNTLFIDGGLTYR